MTVFYEEPGAKVRRRSYILGAGVTGLSAGMVSGWPVLERLERPGGICSSYYLDEKGRRVPFASPDCARAFRFEFGGGHWIFGGDPIVLGFLRSLTSLRSYERKASVYFPDRGWLVPYPLQNHLAYLPRDIAKRCLRQILENHRKDWSRNQPQVMSEWLWHNFGRSLFHLFFYPFHARYTSGLWTRIAPQDDYKTPVDLNLVQRGACRRSTPRVGYNVSFHYPVGGLDKLVQSMAAQCDVRYRSRVQRIDLHAQIIELDNGDKLPYESILSTVPLSKIMTWTGLESGRPDPCTSVLVLNLVGRRGPSCPSDHWVYVPRSRTGFHRVGFYSNVDPDFLPPSHREEFVSLYIEFSRAEGREPSSPGMERLIEGTRKELNSWGWIQEVLLLDPTWIDVAYTWSWPASRWKEKAIRVLQDRRIYTIGRYGRWRFQGIADSIKEGLMAGAALRST